jgi:hypothetical protein
MMSEPRDPGPQHHRSEPESRRPAMIGLAVILALVVGAYFLVGALQRNSALEDCLMAGRRNCAPIETPGSTR